MSTFADVIRQVRNGALELEIEDGLRDLITKVEETGKKGSLTLTFSLKPGNSGQQFLNGTVKAKEPEPTTQDTLFYVSPEGNLTRRDPRQPELPSMTIQTGERE